MRISSATVFLKYKQRTGIFVSKNRVCQNNAHASILYLIQYVVSKQYTLNPSKKKFFLLFSQFVGERVPGVETSQIENPPILVSKYSSRPSIAPSRPRPLSFIPPKGTAADVGLMSLMPTIPKFSPSKSLKAFFKSRV